MIHPNSRVGLVRPYIPKPKRMLAGPGNKAPGVERKLSYEKRNNAKMRERNAAEYALVVEGVRRGEHGAPYNLTREDKMRWRELRGLPRIEFT